jgi:hypothetical protein
MLYVLFSNNGGMLVFIRNTWTSYLSPENSGLTFSYFVTHMTPTQSSESKSFSNQETINIIGIAFFEK